MAQKIDENTENFDKKFAKNREKVLKKALKNAQKSEKNSAEKTAKNSAEKIKISQKLQNAKDKIAKKIPRKKREIPLKITSENISEHREEILAGGRKFKYPLQYSKHKILINTIVIALVALVAFGVSIWAMLYRAQATDDFNYNVARILPLPVANVDGENASYADYLRRIRAVKYYFENVATSDKKDFSTKDGEKEFATLKRQELDAAEKITYAKKIARANKISVSVNEIDDELSAQQKLSNFDAAAQARSIKTYYNWSMDEYRAELSNQILEKKVAFFVDKTAKNKIDKILADLKNGADFAETAKNFSDDAAARETGGAQTAKIGDLDAIGLVAAARKLKSGEISGAISGKTADQKYAYFVVKLNSKTDEETNFSVIQINLAEFDADFAKLQKSDKIHEFIEVEK